MPSGDFETKGAFSDVVLPALLVRALNQRFTGMFRAERDSIIKVIYFKEGDIAFASSNQPSDRLGEVLIKRGQLTREQLDMAMSKLEANVSLGRMLVELGYLSPKELLAGAKAQVEEILFSLNTWQEGTYEFVEGPLASRIVDLKLNMRQVVLQSVMQLDDRNWVLEQIGSMETVFTPTPEMTEAIQSMRLDPGVNDVIGQIDGTNSVRDLCARSSLDEFTVTKTVASFYLLNLCHIASSGSGEGQFLSTFGDEPKVEATTIVGDTDLASSTIPGGFSPSFAASAADDDSSSTLGDTAASSTAVGSSTEEVSFEAADTSGDDDELAYEDEDDWDDDEDALAEPRSKVWMIPAAALVLGGLGGGLWFSGLLGGGDDKTVEITPVASPVAQASPRKSIVPIIPDSAQTTPIPIPDAPETATETGNVPPVTNVTPPLVASSSPTTDKPPTVVPTEVKPPPVVKPPVTSQADIPPPVVKPTAAPTRVAVQLPSPTEKPPVVAPPAVKPPAVKPPAVKPPAVEPPVTKPPVTTPAVTKPPVTKPPVVRPPSGDDTASSGMSQSGTSASATGVVAAAGARTSLGAGDYRAASRAFKQAAPSGYALQLEIVCQDSSVRDGLSRSGGDERYFILPLQYRGKSCYRVLWGVYPNAAGARAAQGSVPAFFRDQLGGRNVPTYRVGRR